MAGGVEGEPPRQAFSQYQDSHPEPSQSRGEGAVNTWLAPVMREGQSAGERTHKNLVEAFRRAIQQQEQVLRGALTPERIVRGQLDWEGRSSNKEKAEFFFHLLRAWDALAFDRYEVDAGLTGSAGYSLYSYFVIVQGDRGF